MLSYTRRFVGGELADETDSPSQQGSVDARLGSGSVALIPALLVRAGLWRGGHVFEVQIFEGDGLMLRPCTKRMRCFVGEVSPDAGLFGFQSCDAE